jgi:hypothetical protein
MILRMPDAWTMLEMPWLSLVGLVSTLFMPVDPVASPIVPETSSVP